MTSQGQASVGRFALNIAGFAAIYLSAQTWGLRAGLLVVVGALIGYFAGLVEQAA